MQNLSTEITGYEGRRLRWAKILTAYQQSSSALRRNDPQPNDGLRLILVKLLRALNGV